MRSKHEASNPAGEFIDASAASVTGEKPNRVRILKEASLLSRPIPLVLSGGTATPKGFRERFETVLRGSDFPLEISEIRMAADPLTATAKGALIAALSEM